PEDQDVVHKVMGEVFQKLNAESRSDNAEAREALQKQGISFVDPLPKDRREWEERTSQTMDKLAAEGVFSPELLKTLRGYLADYRHQHGN
ncbi:MAG: C4-dicarboxylate ABC transporter, partial [Gammaproteobacteria bacterium]